MNRHNLDLELALVDAIQAFSVGEHLAASVILTRLCKDYGDKTVHEMLDSLEVLELEHGE